MSITRRNAMGAVLAFSMALTAPLSFAAVTEGTDYVVLESPVDIGKGTVIKVFSYDCPFCYKYAKAVDKAVMGKLPDMEFVPFHLKTKGKYGLQGSTLFAVALVKDKAAGLKPLDPKSNFHKIEMALYKAYHDKKERWNDGADPDAFIKTGLDAVGWNRAQYDKDATDPKVKELIDLWEVSYPIAKVQGVPAYVVNGKYLLITKNIMSLDSMVNKIKELSAK